MYAERLEGIRKLHEPWATYLHDKKDKFVCCSFLQRDISREGKVTSNGVENVNSAINPARELPILFMTQWLIDYQVSKYVERAAVAKVWRDKGNSLTPYALALNLQNATKATTKDVLVLERNHPFYRARVTAGYSTSTTGYIEVSVDLERHESHCPCKYWEEHGILCPHLKALLLQLGNTSIKWTNERYHLDR